MRWFIIVSVLTCVLSLPGCAWNDLLYSMFGGTDSNGADMNKTNAKNGAGIDQP